MENILYDQTTLDCLAGFGALWQRVAVEATAAESSTHGDADPLFFLREEWCLSCRYTALARQFHHQSRSLLLRHAAETGRHARRLRAEHFICTGQTSHDLPSCPTTGRKLDALRSLLEQELRLSQRYEEAAMHTGSSPLHTLWETLAQRAETRARAVRALILECF